MHLEKLNSCLFHNGSLPVRDAHLFHSWRSCSCPQRGRSFLDRGVPPAPRQARRRPLFIGPGFTGLNQGPSCLSQRGPLSSTNIDDSHPEIWDEKTHEGTSGVWFFLTHTYLQSSSPKHLHLLRRWLHQIGFRLSQHPTRRAHAASAGGLASPPARPDQLQKTGPGTFQPSSWSYHMGIALAKENRIQNHPPSKTETQKDVSGIRH